MQIVHIVLGKANPNRMNGVNKVVYQLASRQAEAGLQVAVWGITPDPVVNFEPRSFETRLFRASRHWFGIPEGFEDALKDLKSPTVFHVHGGWIPVFSQVSRLLKRYGLPFVFTPHGAYNRVAMRRSKWMKKLYFKWFEKSLLQNASRIHCLGESEIQGLKQIWPSAKTQLLPYGYETSGSEQTPSKLRNPIFTIGFIGRMDTYTKGLDLVIEALARLSANGLLFRCWMVGDGPGKAELEKEVSRLGLSANVQFWGSRFGEEKSQLLNGTDLFIHPSRNEGLPASVLEAAKAGVPVLISEATNLGTLVRHYQCGWVVPDEDSGALEKAILEARDLWELDLLLAKGSKGIRMVDTEFDWENLIPQYQTMYQNL